MSERVCSCRPPRDDPFRSIVKLQGCGVNVYIHEKQLVNVSGSSKHDTFIFQNTSNRDVKKDQFMADIGDCSIKCNNCRETLKRARSLLLGLSLLSRNEIVGVCSYCGKNNANTCKKCSFIVKKFVADKINQYEAYKSNIREWLDKVRVLLSDDEKHGKIPTLPSAVEYQKILEDMERPTKETITPFPPKQAETTVKKEQNKEELTLPKAEKEMCCSEYSLHQKENNENGIISKNVAPKKDRKLPVTVTDNLSDAKNNLPMLKTKDENNINGNANTNQLEMRTIKKDRNENKPKIRAQKKVDSKDDLLMKMIKEKAMKKNTVKEVKEKPKPLQVIPDLPTPNRKPRDIQQIDDKKSDSFVVCDPAPEDNDVIHGDSIVQRNSYKKNIIGIKVQNVNEQCLLHKSRYECPNDIEPLPLPPLPASPSAASTPFRGLELKTHRGLRKYALSDKHFINVGWTRLPIVKAMRQINVYKMMPVTASDWFISNKGIEAHFYVTGERFAQIDENGSGKWFYRNGNVALEYFGSPDLYDSQRYCVYSSGKEGDRPVTMIAAFDYLGNAVVRSPHGKLRLKYNQNEGLVIDDAIAIPGKWKWHTLNEPFEFKSVYLETSVDSKVFAPKETGRKVPREPDELMASIELEGQEKQLRQNAQKALKRFQIKKKVLKINENFSLHIVEQTNVFLYFRCSTKSIKLNVGMEVAAEIVGTALVDIDDVTTPYDDGVMRGPNKC